MMNFIATVFLIVGTGLFIWGWNVRIFDIGLMRQNIIVIMASVAFLSGIILFGFSIVSEQVDDLMERLNKNVEKETEEIEDLEHQ